MPAGAEAEDACQSCLAPITWVESAYECAEACTYCAGCAEEMSYTCPDCSGALGKRAAKARKVGR